MSNKKMKKIVFLTGTRADFGKMKSLIQACEDAPEFETHIFATGMHMHAKYGNTVVEIEKCGFQNIFQFINQTSVESMDLTLAHTIEGFSNYVRELNPDLIVLHGDRVEALAGAITGALRNILVAHVEGGEVSGTIDDLMRHATSKLSHIHFVGNGSARKRLVQLGEQEQSIFKIGSPDIDIMFSDDLPGIDEVREHYKLDFESFAIGTLHPVTTEYEEQERNAEIFAEALVDSKMNYVLIYPNNDLGSDAIMRVYQKRLLNQPNIRIIPSLRFEFFLSLLHEARFIIGNSSSGIHEAPVYGVPTINIGSRQDNRFHYESIINVPFDKTAIQNEIVRFTSHTRFPETDHYGKGDSAVRFLKALRSEELWQISQQKKFRDIQHEYN